MSAQNSTPASQATTNVQKKTSSSHAVDTPEQHEPDLDCQLATQAEQISKLDLKLASQTRLMKSQH